MEVLIKKVFDTVETPKYAHEGDACFDLSVVINDKTRPIKVHADYKHEVTPTKVNGKYTIGIAPQETIILQTGLKFEIPSGSVMLIYARSSTGFKKHLALTNGTGVIDSGYRGEVKIALTNIGDTVVSISDGDRVAQAMILPIPQVTLKVVDSLGESERGENGIGSTGV